MLRNEQKIEDEIQIPDELLCPVTRLIFLDPVIVYPSKQIFEREIIEALTQMAKQQNCELICPLTRIPITHYESSDSVKSNVENFLTNNPNVSNQRYVREKPSEAYLVQKPIVQNNTDYMESDAELARELDRQEREQFARENQRQLESQRELEKQKQSQEAYRQKLIKEQQAKEVKVINLSYSDQKIRDKLIDDVQNLIFALGFETGPKPRGRIDNFALLFFAMIEQALLEPLPWQKIKVNTGPKSQEMYQTLKAAIRALKETNPEILEKAKLQNAEKYDLVKTWLGGELSLGKSGYAVFAQTMGTINNQPGDHVSRLLREVEKFLAEKCIHQLNNNYTNYSFKK